MPGRGADYDLSVRGNVFRVPFSISTLVVALSLRVLTRGLRITPLYLDWRTYVSFQTPAGFRRSSGCRISGLARRCRSGCRNHLSADDQ
ncbi:hypothetical protein AGR1B_Lc10578 [Agrobacterium fabacearum S56]|nr:hypothetical protein AGR1B_Lc10578 [Agrobacterium fabacearum S56]CUW99915.1 hypothetical protein AGR1C_Lc20386 [Agrobacterium fabacearum TT111]